MIESFRFEVVSVHSVLGSNPEHPGTVLEDGIHNVIRQALRIRGIVQKSSKRSRLAFESVNTSVVSPNPNLALPIFVNCPDFVVRKTRGIIRIAAITLEFVGCLIPDDESACCAEKEVSVLIFV